MELYLKYYILFLIYIINGINTSELMELTCTESFECRHYQHSNIKAQCEDGHCRCETDLGDSTNCKPKVTKKNNIIGGMCPCSMQNAECDKQQNICYCSSEYMPSVDKRSCLPRNVPLGRDCELDVQCEMFGNFHVECHPKEKKCNCLEGFITNIESSKCYSLIGGNSANCSATVDCAKFGGNAMCMRNYGQCYCDEGFVKVPNVDECLRIVQYGGNCNADVQCQSASGLGSICSNGICKCDLKHFPHKTVKRDGMETRCIPIIKFGQYCRNNIDCYQPQLSDQQQTMDCIYGECNCKEDFHFNNNECVSAVNDLQLSIPIVLVVTFSLFLFSY